MLPSRIFILLLLIITSCATTLSKEDKHSAKLSFLNSANNKKAFSFAISDDFIKNHIDSKPSELYSKMNVDELALLTKFLQNNNYCINKNGELSFKITSKQDKVYDITFSSLIEQNYNARPISPATYFGECL